MKSPMKRSRRSDTPFSKEQEIWLILNCKGQSKMELRRAFIRHFAITNHNAVPAPNAFARIVKRFQATGGVTGACKPEEFRFTARTPENIERVKTFFEESPRESIRGVMEKLNLSFATTWRILRLDLHWKPYRLHMTNRLTPENCLKRESFSRWLLTKGEGFLQKVISSNEMKTKDGGQ